jgi:hypothetical protein
MDSNHQYRGNSGISVVSALVRAACVGGVSSDADMTPQNLVRVTGTDGSNPLPSSGESDANRTSSP